MADEAGVGRLLVASLHQGIADVLPTRLEFYESWLNPSGLRDGRIGLAPMAAVLSFLRLEGEPYGLVAERAGEYTAEWSVSEMSGWHRSMLDALPPAMRARLVMRYARTMIRSTYGGSRVIVRWRQGRAEVDIRGSIFCEVREPVPEPLCVFYVAAIARLMRLFHLDAEVTTDHCRATREAPGCVMALSVKPAGAQA
jgi:hypothetical protein